MVENLISNLIYNNICVYIRLTESMVEYIRQLQSFATKQNDYFIKMTEALIKSIEQGGSIAAGKDVTYLTGFLKGYESCRDDMLTKKKSDDGEIVEIPDTKVATPPTTYSPISSKEPAHFYM